jgi:hypothetical protein
MNTSIVFQRKTIARTLLITAITAIALGGAATAHADDGVPGPNVGGPAHAVCKTEPFGFLGSHRRTLCDGPISSDGSWSRERTIVVPAHYSTPICSSSGSSYSGIGSLYTTTNCYGGYWVNERLVSNETYPVRPETVLPDEPGHLD